MQLELLANEIIIDIFEYLKPVHLLRVFHNLNNRFNTLLFYYFRTRTFHFQFVSNVDFDIVCRQHLPSMINQITSLRLSDNDNIPYQIDRFLAYGFRFQELTQLQSLTLDCDSCKQVQDKILFELRYLSTELTHLTIIFNSAYYSLKEGDVRSQSLVNIIWSLPKLIHCKIHMEHFPIPTTVSSSIKYLSILDECSYSCYDIKRLFEYTPHLQHLTLPTLRSEMNDHHLSSSMTSIITLSLGFYHITENKLINFLQKMPNLHKLTFHMVHSYIDGEKLEQIIRQDLINLKILRFKMCVKYDHLISIEKVNELLKLYSSPFWREEHQWFVQCDWRSDSSCINLYTLPYAFDAYDLHWPIESQSTCFLDHALYHSHNRVQKLRVQHTANHKSLLSNIHFSKVTHLSLSYSIINLFQSIISNFDHLTSLYLITYKHCPKYQSLLQALLDRSVHLHRLYFYSYTYSTWARPPFEFQHKSIRELGLIHAKYSNKQCVALARSSLGMQCEVLYIYIKNRTCIVDLIKTMTNLRFLYVICYENQRNRSSSPTIDQLMEWLQSHISSQWTMARMVSNSSPLVLWLR